jgi:excisionase family DNA binding protein
MATKEQTLFTITEAAEELKVSRQTVYDWLRKGKLYTVTIGSIKFIPMDAIKRAKS